MSKLFPCQFLATSFQLLIDVHLLIINIKLSFVIFHVIVFCVNLCGKMFVDVNTSWCARLIVIW